MVYLNTNMSKYEREVLKSGALFSARELQLKVLQDYALRERALEDAGLEVRKNLSVYASQLVELNLFPFAIIIPEDTPLNLSQYKYNEIDKEINFQPILPVSRINTVMDSNGYIYYCDYFDPKLDKVNYIVYQNDWDNKSEIPLSNYTQYHLDALDSIAQLAGRSLPKRIKNT